GLAWSVVSSQSDHAHSDAFLPTCRTRLDRLPADLRRVSARRRSSNWRIAMRWTLRTRWSAVIALVGLGLTLPAAAEALAPGVGASFASGDPLLIEAKHAKVHVKSFNGKTVKVNKH